MFCTRCGADIGDNPVCLQCGQPAEDTTSIYHAPIPEPLPEGNGPEEEFTHAHAVRLTLANAMSSPLLIAAGILLIVECILSAVIYGRAGRGAASLTLVFSILKGAGLLAAAFTARKKQEHYLGEGSGLLRVMLMIEFVLGWVLFGLLCLVLVFMLAFRSAFYSVFEWIQQEMPGVSGFTLTANGGMSQTMMTIMYWAIIAVIAAVAICYFFWTLFYLRGRVVMGRDIMTSLREGHFYVSRVRAVRGWSLAIAILLLISGGITTAAGSLSFDQGVSPATGLVTLAGAAVYFLVFLWVGNYFIPKNS